MKYESNNSQIFFEKPNKNIANTSTSIMKILNNKNTNFNLEDCLKVIDDKGYYQIRTVIMLAILWGFVPVIAVLLPFLP